MPIRLIEALHAIANKPSVALTFLALFLVYWITSSVQASQKRTDERMTDLMGQMIHLTAATADHQHESRSQTRVLRAMCINWAPTQEAQQRCLLE